jgi:hypothetical protein
MFIAYKKSGNNLIAGRGTEWQCRMTAKEIDLTAYKTWLSTITDSDGVVTYPSETFTIVEVTDEEVGTRISQLQDYTNSNRSAGEAKVYNIKWSNSKVNCEEIKDGDGNSHDPKQYVQSHFKGDDTAKTARILAEQWALVRAERDILLTSTDWTQGNDTPLSDADKAEWTTYRASLRTLPVDQSSKTTYASITWPDKP